MRRARLYSLLLALVLLVALAVTVWMRKQAPPEAARLLPESDAIVYVNLKPVRSVTHLDRSPVTRAPEFQKFIDATGIVPERDLDEAAFALHATGDPGGPNGAVAYSEVFAGRFDGERLRRYLRSLASGVESYAGHEVYTIPIGDPTVKGGGRQLRVAQLGYDMVAASNMPTAEQIHLMLDRYRAAASPFSGSSLLSARYRDVPLFSSAWGIGRIGLPFAEKGRVTVFGLGLPIPEDTMFVASLRYTGSLRLRVEQIAPTEADAERAAEVLTTMVGLARTVEQAQPREADDAAAAKAMDSLRVERRGDRAVVTGTVPAEVVRRIFSAGGTPPS